MGEREIRWAYGFKKNGAVEVSYPFDVYGVRCVQNGEGVRVEIGDGKRANLSLSVGHWNQLVGMIKYGKLNERGVEALVSGVMKHYIPEEYRTTFVSAIREGKIGEVKE